MSSTVLFFPYTLILADGTLSQQMAQTVMEIPLSNNAPTGQSNVVLTQQFGTFPPGAYQWSPFKQKWIFMFDYAALCTALFSIADAYVSIPNAGETIIPIGASGEAIVDVTRNGVPETNFTLNDTGVQLSEPSVAGDVFFVAQQSPLKPATLIIPGGIADAPNTGLNYLRKNGTWVLSSTALASYVQSVNGVTPVSGNVTLTPVEIGASLIGNTLFTAPSVASAVTALSVVPTSSVGAANGVAPLNSGGIVPNANLPGYIGSINGLTPTANALSLGVSNIPGAVASINGVTPVSGDVSLSVANISGAAPVANPAFTGLPAAPTAPLGTNTTQIATTAFVEAGISANAYALPTASPFTLGGVMVGSGLSIASGTLSANVLSVNGMTGAVTGIAPLASPAFTGIPTAPTAGLGISNSQVATTSFVANAIAANAYVLPNATTSTLGGVIVGSGLSVTSGTVSANVLTVCGRTGAVVLAVSDVAGSAPLASPALTGIPTVPTATNGTNTAQIASTAFVQSAVSGSVTSFNTRTGAVVLTAADVSGVGGALLASPSLSGTPTTPTATTGTNTTQIASTAFVDASIAANAYVLPNATTSTLGGVIVGSGLSVASGTVSANVLSVAGRTGAVVLAVADVSGAAPLASPALTGVPTSPTATAGTNTTQVATTAFVVTALSPYAPLASPALTGNPTAPTATAGTSTTQVATTAFVATSYAPLASPALTGTPTAPTAAIGTDTTQVSTTAFVYNSARSSSARTVTAATGTISTADQYVGVNYAGSVAIALNAGSTFNQGQRIVIKDESGSAATRSITVTANGSDKIDGQSGFVIALNYGSIEILWNTDHWSII